LTTRNPNRRTTLTAHQMLLKEGQVTRHNHFTITLKMGSLIIVLSHLRIPQHQDQPARPHPYPETRRTTQFPYLMQHIMPWRRLSIGKIAALGFDLKCAQTVTLRDFPPMGQISFLLPPPPSFLLPPGMVSATELLALPPPTSSHPLSHSRSYFRGGFAAHLPPDLGTTPKG
jgi:hypothetical protein